ncbi:MAG: hypothetical protein ACRD0H_05480 [Actinomycetes bacterium]
MGEADLRLRPVGVWQQLGRGVAGERRRRDFRVEEAVAGGNEEVLDGHHHGAALRSPPTQPGQWAVEGLDVVVVALVGDTATRAELSSHRPTPGERSGERRR